MEELRDGRGRCAIATTALPAGTIVRAFSGKPYASVLLPSQRERHCAACFKDTHSVKRLLRCGRCKWARYCSGCCQKAAWIAHKHECAALTDAACELHRLADAPAADCLLVGRCLWRRHDANLSEAGDDDLAFDALEPGVPSASDYALGRLAASISGLLPPAASLEASAEAAARLMSTFERNNFGVLNDLLSVVGAGCYPRAALLNHSCAPNCALAFDGLTVEIRTMAAVAAGEELCHAYVELCQPTGARRETLRSRYGFECACSRCVDGLRTAAGEDMDAVMAMHLLPDGGPDSNTKRLGCTSVAAEAALDRAAQLLEAAASEEDEAAELRKTLEALRVRRELCHPLSTARYEAEGRGLTIALAVGDLPSALEACRHAVAFLEAALAHVPSHPMLALQRFTLSDLEGACGEPRAALRVMDACAAAVELTASTSSSLRAQAASSLAGLRQQSNCEI